jgi:outer membrane lipoprotein-sorting protein
VRLLRTLSTGRLLAAVAVVVAVAVGGSAIAVAASRSGGPTPPAKPLAQAIHDSLAAPAVAGITARIKFTNRLFPSGALLGGNGSALMSGASGRLWLTGDGRGRLELQADAGDAQIVWNDKLITVYDASTNTVYKLARPSSPAPAPGDNGNTPSVTQIGDFLTKLGQHADVSAAQPTNVAGQPAYRVKVSPKHDGGLLGYAELAWDAARGVPLRAAVYAQGGSKPVLELAATDISYGAVSSSNVDVSPPAGAKTIDLSAPSKPASGGSATDVTGLAPVQAAVGFNVVAPETLVGLPRKDVRAVGGSDSKAALAVYGQGLGALIVVERKAPAAGQKQGLLSSLPAVSLDGLTGHELATQLGTIIEWERNGVSYVLGGSLPPAAAEAAARALK